MLFFYRLIYIVLVWAYTRWKRCYLWCHLKFLSVSKGEFIFMVTLRSFQFVGSNPLLPTVRLCVCQCCYQWVLHLLAKTMIFLEYRICWNKFNRLRRCICTSSFKLMSLSIFTSNTVISPSVLYQSHLESINTYIGK